MNLIRGLRFDKVAVRFTAALQAALRDDVPLGKTLLFAVSAPIRLPKQTANVLEERVRRWLGRSSQDAEFRNSINGNQIRVRLVSGSAAESHNILGFVHNPGIDTNALFAAAQADLTI